MILTTSQMNQLAWAIDSDGIARHEDEARLIVFQARAARIESPLVDVLADTSLPAPVRERAFGKVVNALARVEADASPEWALAN